MSEQRQPMHARVFRLGVWVSSIFAAWNLVIAVSGVWRDKSGAWIAAYVVFAAFFAAMALWTRRRWLSLERAGLILDD